MYKFKKDFELVWRNDLIFFSCFFIVYYFFCFCSDHLRNGEEFRILVGFSFFHENSGALNNHWNGPSDISH